MADVPSKDELIILLDQKLTQFADRIVAALKGKDMSQRKWFKACELKKILPLSDYRIAEMRARGMLDFQKIGGTYYYTVDSINSLIESKGNI